MTVNDAAFHDCSVPPSPLPDQTLPFTKDITNLYSLYVCHKRSYFHSKNQANIYTGNPPTVKRQGCRTPTPSLNLFCSHDEIFLSSSTHAEALRLSEGKSFNLLFSLCLSRVRAPAFDTGYAKSVGLLFAPTFDSSLGSTHETGQTKC